MKTSSIDQSPNDASVRCAASTTHATNGHRLVFTSPRNAELQDFSRPVLDAGQVLVRTQRTLLSPGTELSFFEGTNHSLRDPASLWAKYPFVSGYAALGTVIEVGPGVSSPRLGDRIMHFGPHATWSVLTPDRQPWVPVTSDLPDEAWLMARMVQIAGTVSLGLRAKPQRALVLGAGLVGILAAQVLAAIGVPEVSILDTIPDRIALARRCGLVRAIAVSAGDFSPALALLSGLPDCVVEAIGLVSLIPTALSVVRPRGDVVLLGSPREPISLNVYKLIHRSGAALLGAHECMVPDRSSDGAPSRQSGLEQAVAWLRSGLIQVAPLASANIEQEELSATYVRLSANRDKLLGVFVNWN